MVTPFFLGSGVDQLVGINHPMVQASQDSPSKREKFLGKAAEKLMLKRGLWDTTVDDICEAAVVTQGSFIYYFEDKEQLALEALARFVNAIVGCIRQAIANSSSGDEFSHTCSYCHLIAEVAQVQEYRRVA